MTLTEIMAEYKVQRALQLEAQQSVEEAGKELAAAGKELAVLAAAAHGITKGKAIKVRDPNTGVVTPLTPCTRSRSGKDQWYFRGPVEPKAEKEEEFLVEV